MSSISITKRVLQNQVIDIPNGDLHEIELMDDYDRIQLALSVAKDSNGAEVFSVSSSTNKIVLVNADGTPVEPGDTGTTDPLPDEGEESPVPTVVEYKANHVNLEPTVPVQYLTAEIKQTIRDTNTVNVLGTIEIDLGTPGTVDDILAELTNRALTMGLYEPIFTIDDSGSLSGIYASVNKTTSDVYTGTYDTTENLVDWLPTVTPEELDYGIYTLDLKETTGASDTALDLNTIVEAAGLVNTLLKTGVAKINLPVEEVEPPTVHEGTLFTAEAEQTFKTAALDVVHDDGTGPSVLGSVSVDLPEAAPIADLLAAILEDIELQDIVTPMFEPVGASSISGVQVTVPADGIEIEEVVHNEEGGTDVWVPVDGEAEFLDGKYSFVVKATEELDADTALDLHTALTTAGVPDTTLYTGVAKVVAEAP